MEMQEHNLSSSKERQHAPLLNKGHQPAHTGSLGSSFLLTSNMTFGKLLVSCFSVLTSKMELIIVPTSQDSWRWNKEHMIYRKGTNT